MKLGGVFTDTRWAAFLFKPGASSSCETGVGLVGASVACGSGLLNLPGPPPQGGAVISFCVKSTVDLNTLLYVIRSERKKET